MNSYYYGFVDVRAISLFLIILSTIPYFLLRGRNGLIKDIAKYFCFCFIGVVLAFSVSVHFLLNQKITEADQMNLENTISQLSSQPNKQIINYQMLSYIDKRKQNLSLNSSEYKDFLTKRDFNKLISISTKNN